MVIFKIVFFKILSSLIVVLIGFIAGKKYKIDGETISTLLFYFIAPIVFFSIMTSTSFKAHDFIIIVISFSMSAIMSIASFIGYKKIWQDFNRNILSFSAGTGNTGYIVLPIAAELFDSYTLGIYTLALIGVAFYEISIGYYICSFDKLVNRWYLVKKILKLPIFIAFILGCILNFLGFTVPVFLIEFNKNIQGTFSFLGVLLVGIALSQIKEFKVELKFILASFANKFLFLPLLTNFFILLDYFLFKIYAGNVSYYNALNLLSLAPLASNVVVMSSLYRAETAKVASTVLMSIIFVLLYMPLMCTILIKGL